MRFNEDWLINQYENRLELYKLDLKNCKEKNYSEQITKYRALIIATEEFIKDLKELKDESI
jgi:hypothetical protein